MQHKCRTCEKTLGEGDSVFLLSTARYHQRMTEKAEFGWSAHYAPVAEWCYGCGSRRWSAVRGECPFCADALAAGAPVFCLVSGDLQAPTYRALGRRRAHFIAHRRCV